MLFNKSSNGAIELKAILGFIYATNSFDNLKTDMVLVQDDMINLLGKDLYNALDDFYHSENYELAEPDPDSPGPAIWTELVHRVQSAMAFYGYRNYAIHADLTHSAQGRQIIVTETEKPAFEWMIERDDQSMLAKAHKLTDRILVYLEENKDEEKINEYWTTKPVYAATRQLFINNAREFDDAFPIDCSRRFYLKVIPFIREVENTRIRAVLGEHLWEELKTEISTNTISDDNSEVYPLIRVPLALFTMAISVKRLSVEILPEGVFQNYVPGVQSMKAKNPSPIEMKNEIARNLELEAAKTLLILQEYLAKKKAAFDGVEYEEQNLNDRNSADNKFFFV